MWDGYLVGFGAVGLLEAILGLLFLGLLRLVWFLKGFCELPDQILDLIRWKSLKSNEVLHNPE